MSIKFKPIKCQCCPHIVTSQLICKAMLVSVEKLVSKNYHAVTAVVLIEMSFLTSGAKRKNKNENTDYHSIFILFESKFCSRQRSPNFLLFGSWISVLFMSSCLGKVKVFFQSNLIILDDVQRLHENDI